MVKLIDSTVTVEGNKNVGGVIGLNRGVASNIKSEGDITGKYRVGGIVGYGKSIQPDPNTKLLNSEFKDGDVRGLKNVGGGQGFTEGQLQASVYNADVSGETSVGGITGRLTGQTVGQSYYANLDVEATNFKGSRIGLET